MAQGNYDHPSYIVRQIETVGPSTAGANGTSFAAAFPVPIRFRGFTANVVTAGTTAGATMNAISLVGTVTTTLASVALSTSTANSVVTSTDPNALIPVGGLLYFTNGTDATGKSNLAYMFHIDPTTGTWGGP
jgi:hypothetical protein